MSLRASSLRSSAATLTLLTYLTSIFAPSAAMAAEAGKVAEEAVRVGGGSLSSGSSRQDARAVGEASSDDDESMGSTLGREPIKGPEEADRRRLENIEDIQLVLRHRYWSRVSNTEN